MGKKDKEAIAVTAVAEETAVLKEAEASGGSLARIEKLLEQQNEYTHKLLQRANIRTWAVAVLVVVALVFMIVALALFNSFSSSLEKLPVLIDSAEVLVETINTDVSNVLNETLADIKKLDFDNMNNAISGIKKTADGISAIDFEALNSSIQNLRDGTNVFKAFVDGLKSFSLFGQ